jgi:hypothetical protein
MRITSPFAVALTESETQTLTALIVRPSAAVRDVLRAKIVLMAAAGQTNPEIARAPRVCADTVRKWPKMVAGQRDSEATIDPAFTRMTLR